MIIGLASALNIDNDIDYNIEQIRNFAKQAKEESVDLICFGESFLQGFDCLTWNYEKDYKVAQCIESKAISKIKEIAISNNIAISFGMIEKDNNLLYSSNVIIDECGNIIDIFRRVSPEWKESVASDKYCEGKEFHTFIYKGKKFTTAICGDLWHDANLLKIKNKKVDVVLWPLYVDYSVEEWESGELNDYAERVKCLNSPVCFINSYVKKDGGANGGCYVFIDGNVKYKLDMGNLGLLKFEV